MRFDFCEDWYRLDEEFERAKRAAEKKKDLITELLSDLESPEPGPKFFDIDSYFQDRVATSKRGVDQVWKELESRAEMNGKFISEIDSQVRYIQFSLEKFTGWGVGYNTSVDVKRNHLERQLQQLRTERRAVELRTWEDLVRLRKELREVVKEYKSTRIATQGL